ncbi:MAG TPA: hypothetical protein VHA07_13385 [Devosia sp.]|nr:hypothetical protein [Devosia sp.]
MKKLVLAAAAVLTAATFGAAGAYAQADSDFSKADANHDNQVTFEEAVAVNAQLTQDLFTKADADGNGWLDEAEFGTLIGLTGAATTGVGNSGGTSSEASSSSAM